MSSICYTSGMCGRYVFAAPEKLAERYGLLLDTIEFMARYNAAPTQQLPVITKRANTERTAEWMRWGLVPRWAKDPAIGQKMINARAETILEKPSFRKPLAQRRCLIPATGFYEWKREGTGKVPYFFHLIDGDIFSFAGLYETWKDASGTELKTYTIITTAPNALVARVHNRMPVILEREVEEQWLDPTITDPAVVLPLLKSYPAERMNAYPVSTLVNRVEHDAPALQQPLL